MSGEATRAETVYRLAQRLGFARCGIAPAQPSEYTEHVRRWIAQGRHGQMDYLEKELDVRLDPARLVPGARSIICVADLYASAATPPTGSVGRIARYAWGHDYHPTIKNRLHDLADALRVKWPDEQYRTCVDTAPLLEREHAMRAGLGWVGKHTLLIHPQLGSWLALGCIVTTLPLQPSAQDPDRGVIADHCGTCRRCIDACPTQCIDPQGYSIDASRCISYLTIEHRDAIPADLLPAIGNWVAGCDVCQEVCPFNQELASGKTTSEDEAAARPAVHPRYTPQPRAAGIPLLEVLNWTPETRQAALHRSALKRIKLDMFKRNALIAAGNCLARHDDPGLLSRIRDLSTDPAEPELVRTTARQVLDALADRVGSGDGRRRAVVTAKPTVHQG